MPAETVAYRGLHRHHLQKPSVDEVHPRYRGTTRTLIARARHGGELRGELMATLDITKVYREPAISREPTTPIPKTAFADTRVPETSSITDGQHPDRRPRRKTCRIWYEVRGYHRRCAREHIRNYVGLEPVDRPGVRHHGTHTIARSTTCTTWRPVRSTPAGGRPARGCKNAGGNPIWRRRRR